MVSSSSVVVDMVFDSFAGMSISRYIAPLPPENHDFVNGSSYQQNGMPVHQPAPQDQLLRSSLGEVDIQS